MNKRGSHVEVIISFIIFVTFMVFVFYMVRSPLSKQEDKNNIFDGIELKIMERISSDLTSITANLGAGPGNCVNLDNFVGTVVPGRNMIVRDSSGNIVNSKIDGNSLQINRANPTDDFFKIYYSEEFNELGTASGCSGLGYEIGFIKTSSYVFEKNFLELMGEDYPTLKTYMDIPKGVNFGYGLVLSNGTKHEKPIGNLSANIYIRETPIEYVNLDGEISEGYLRTIIW